MKMSKGEHKMFFDDFDLGFAPEELCEEFVDINSLYEDEF